MTYEQGWGPGAPIRPGAIESLDVELFGVLETESIHPAAFLERHAQILGTAGQLLGQAMARHHGEEDDEPAASRPSTEGEPLRVKWYEADDSILVDDEYLIKGLPGRILYLLLSLREEDGRASFTNRELRLHPLLKLPSYKDNLETCGKKGCTAGGTVADTLADVAMAYWKNDLRTETAMANNVPKSNADPAFWQHMVTFGVSNSLVKFPTALPVFVHVTSGPVGRVVASKFTSTPAWSDGLSKAATVEARRVREGTRRGSWVRGNRAESGRVWSR